MSSLIVRARQQFIVVALAAFLATGVCMGPAQEPARRTATTRHANVGPDAERQRLADLEKRYRQALEANPDSVLLLNGLASVLREDGKKAVALQTWKEALRLQPENEQVQLSVATLQLDIGNVHEAVVALQDLTAKNHDLQPAFFALGSALCRLSDFSSCSASYERAVQLDGSDRIARQCLAKALLAQHFYGQAIESLKAYAAAHQDDTETRYLLGIAYRGNSEPVLAEAEFMSVLHSEERPADLETELGSTFAEEGKMTEALPHLERALEQNANDAEAHAHLILVLRTLHRRIEANREAATLSKLKQTQIEQDKTSLLRSGAKAMVENGKPQEAMRLYEEALASTPWDATLHYERALVEDKLGDQDAERQDLQEALALSPTLANAHNQLGILKIRSGEMEAAERELKAALALEPAHFAALGNLAVAEAHRGQVAQAIAHLRTALQVNPDYEEGYRNLGVLLATRGDMQEAREKLNEALTLDAKDTIARELLIQLGALTPRAE